MTTLNTPDPSADRSLAFWAACLAIAAVGENSTAIMAALPAMARAYALDAAGLEWVVNAYLLASASFIVLGGEVAGRWGARRSSAAGAVVFGLASAAVALAPSASAIIAARALQGVGAAFAVAGTLAAVTIGVRESERALRIGSWTGFLMLGFSIGPLLGGALTHALAWQSVFWLNAAAMLVAAAGLAWRGRAETRPAPVSGGIDWQGFVLLAAFMLAFIFGVRALPAIGRAPLASLAPLAAALAALAALIAVERRRARPFFDLGFFARRRFRLGAALIFLSMLDILVLLLFYNLYAQAEDGLRMSAIEAGLSLVPLSVALLLVARLTPRIVRRFGLGRTMMAGSLLTAAGAVAVDRALASGALPALGLALVAVGAGLALPYASAPRLGLSALGANEQAKGSGMLNASSFLGGTVGVTAGGIAQAFYGIDGAMGLLALAGLLGAALCCWVPDEP